jgi:hypothetical protein
MPTTENLHASKSLEGFVKIWQFDPKSGASTLLVDKKNMILKGGAKLITHCLAGRPESKIWGMYIGYNNSSGEFLKPDIDVDYSNPFAGFSSPFGYLREPLTFTPNFISSVGYDENTVLFSTMVTSATSAGGAEFNETSKIYEVALVAAPQTQDVSQDVVFSRTNFNPIQYNSSYNFTITWGVRILLP